MSPPQQTDHSRGTLTSISPYKKSNAQNRQQRPKPKYLVKDKTPKSKAVVNIDIKKGSVVSTDTYEDAKKRKLDQLKLEILNEDDLVDDKKSGNSHL